MKYSAALGVAARSCFAGLLIGGYISSLGFSLLLCFEQQAPVLGWLETPLKAVGVLFLAVGFAILPVTLFAMPTYALLVQHGRAAYWSALAILVAFSCVLWLFTESGVAIFVALFGAPIAVVTHRAYKVGSNMSFKPTSLRDAA